MRGEPAERESAHGRVGRANQTAGRRDPVARKILGKQNEVATHLLPTLEHQDVGRQEEHRPAHDGQRSSQSDRIEAGGNLTQDLGFSDMPISYAFCASRQLNTSEGEQSRV